MTYRAWQITHLSTNDLNDAVKQYINIVGKEPERVVLHKSWDIVITDVPTDYVTNISKGIVYFYPPMARLPRIINVQRRPVI